MLHPGDILILSTPTPQVFHSAYTSFFCFHLLEMLVRHFYEVKSFQFFCLAARSQVFCGYKVTNKTIEIFWKLLKIICRWRKVVQEWEFLMKWMPQNLNENIFSSLTMGRFRLPFKLMRTCCHGHTLEANLRTCVFGFVYNVSNPSWTHDAILHMNWWFHAFTTHVIVAI